MIDVYLTESIKTLTEVRNDRAAACAIEKIVNAIYFAFSGDKKLLIVGNGGSAADAQHIAGEFVGRFALNRPALPALALTADGAVLTALSNDFGFSSVFSRQISAFGRRGDVFIALSTSGKSDNILAAINHANELGLTTIGFTGAAPYNPMPELCSVCFCAPSTSTPIIQQVHLTVLHAICAQIEHELFGENPSPRAARAVTSADGPGT